MTKVSSHLCLFPWLLSLAQIYDLVEDSLQPDDREGRKSGPSLWMDRFNMLLWVKMECFHTNTTPFRNDYKSHW